VEAVVIEGDVDVEDVAILEDSLVRNTVADDLIDRCTYGLGEVAVIERRGIGLN
jgi:hypothetical protein